MFSTRKRITSLEANNIRDITSISLSKIYSNDPRDKDSIKALHVWANLINTNNL